MAIRTTYVNSSAFEDGCFLFGFHETDQFITGKQVSVTVPWFVMRMIRFANSRYNMQEGNLYDMLHPAHAEIVYELYLILKSLK